MTVDFVLTFFSMAFPLFLLKRGANLVENGEKETVFGSN